MGIVKGLTKSYRRSERSHMLKDKLRRVEIDNDRLFTLESLGAPERVHLPVDIIERQKFSKIAESSIKKISAKEILCKKREDLKKNLKDFIDVAFPSSTSPYRYLMSSPGPVSSLEKFYLANRRKLKPPKYKLYFDASQNSYFYTLHFNDNVELSDAMPIKVLAKLQVAHKALMRIRKQTREKSAKERVERERRKAMKETSEAKMSMEVNQAKDQHHRVRRLCSDKKHVPKDDNWFMRNVSHRNFALFREFYPNTEEPVSMSKKRKNIDWNEEGTFQEGRVIKRIRLEKENEAVVGVIDDNATSINSFREIVQPANINFKAGVSIKVVNNIQENVIQEFQSTDRLILNQI